ncbi:hypothetical protein CDN99_19475 [Roseateles aquatilis]|uniref:Uncharacterized protein n=1 Tax=Roseateles aquatilis TaxID=431061 RepID=A0A246J367_9BURK|nr:hypothetical protein [Roseateles aquatilis]OWQ86892.1 hypothetical protein CDN99_19475 [Roseateles aquatilis]
MWHAARQRLRLRQLELQLRSAELRLGLIHDAQALERPMQWAERGHALWRLLGSAPRAWRTLGALGAAGGLAGLFRAFRRKGRSGDGATEGSGAGRIARLWTWVSLGWRLWRWMKPAPAAEASRPPDPAAPQR